MKKKRIVSVQGVSSLDHITMFIMYGTDGNMNKLKNLCIGNTTNSTPRKSVKHSPRSITTSVCIRYNNQCSNVAHFKLTIQKSMFLNSRFYCWHKQYYKNIVASKWKKKSIHILKKNQQQHCEFWSLFLYIIETWISNE